jgi:hypothetical protein
LPHPNCGAARGIKIAAAEPTTTQQHQQQLEHRGVGLASHKHGPTRTILAAAVGGRVFAENEFKWAHAGRAV